MFFCFFTALFLIEPEGDENTTDYLIINIYPTLVF